MNVFRDLWIKFRENKEYREEFVSAQVKRGIPFQIRGLMKKRGISQEKLASAAGLTQGVISRAANPNYGNLTLNTIVRIAAGFDVAFIGKFVPFSELGDWFSNLSEDSVQVDTFEEENKIFEQEKVIPKSNQGLKVVAKRADMGNATHPIATEPRERTILRNTGNLPGKLNSVKQLDFPLMSESQGIGGRLGSVQNIMEGNQTSGEQYGTSKRDQSKIALAT